MGLFGGAVVNFGAMGRLAGQKEAKILAGTKAATSRSKTARLCDRVQTQARKDLGIEISPRCSRSANAIYKDDLLPLHRPGGCASTDRGIKSF